MRRTAALFLIILLAVSCGRASAEGGVPGWLAETEEPGWMAAMTDSRTAVRLDPVQATLNKGGTRRITAAVIGLPAGVKVKSYDWASSDPRVAVYRDGNIRAVGYGEAVLTCSALLTDGTTRWAECRVTVRVPVSALQADSRTINVMVGDVFAPAIRVVPAEADKAIRYTSSDGSVVRPMEDGLLEAAGEGQATVTAAAESNPDKQLRITVNVTRRLGKAEGALTFQGIPWESDSETCIRLLKESGFIAEDAPNRTGRSDSVWHWPEKDLLFTRPSAWRLLPVEFSDRKTGAERTSLNPLKTVGGFMPQVSTLVYLNGIGADGKIDAETTRLIGAYFSFDNRHEKGSVIFTQLLRRLEEQYGAFTRYIPKDFSRYYPDLCAAVEGSVKNATPYSVQELGEDLYLGEYVLCVLHGQDHTGIMLSIDTNESVTLFYGRTDAETLIAELKEALGTADENLEDAGV